MVKYNLDRRLYIYFYASFMNAGLQNVIPQVFFGEHYPQQEALLLSICLLTGAASSIATIWMTGTYRTPEAEVRKRTVWIQALSIGVLLVCLWQWQTAWLYIVTFMLLRGLVQALFNRVDHRYVAMTEPQHMSSFARHCTLLRLVGVMAAPFYFALIYPYIGFNTGILIILSAILLWSLSSLFVTSSAQAQAATSSEEVRRQGTQNFHIKSERTSPRFNFFILYLLTATTGVYVFSSNIYMVVRDMYGVSSAIAKSGMLLMLMNATGIAIVAIWPMLSKKMRRVTDKLFSGQAIYALLFLMSVTLMKFPFVLSYTYLLTLSMFTGAVYGLFWMKTRQFVIDDRTKGDNRWLLTLYNNANNFSILFSSLVLLVVALLSAKWGGSYINMITTALIVCFAVSSIYAIRLDIYMKNNRKE